MFLLKLPYLLQDQTAALHPGLLADMLEMSIQVQEDSIGPRAAQFHPGDSTSFVTAPVL